MIGAGPLRLHGLSAYWSPGSWRNIWQRPGEDSSCLCSVQSMKRLGKASLIPPDPHSGGGSYQNNFSGIQCNSFTYLVKGWLSWTYQFWNYSPSFYPKLYYTMVIDYALIKYIIEFPVALHSKEWVATFERKFGCELAATLFLDTDPLTAMKIYKRIFISSRAKPNRGNLTM